jgi:hypothetical protein
MLRDGYKTLQEISSELNTSLNTLRTIVARLGIQPTRFPGDLRKLYYRQEDIVRIKDALGLS